MNTTLGGVPYLPLTSWHTHSRSAGIPTEFPLQTSTLKVNGLPQTTRRGLRNWDVTAQRYPAEVWNINNAARNLLEIIANEARSDDDGDYPIRIYTIIANTPSSHVAALALLQTAVIFAPVALLVIVGVVVLVALT